MVLVAIASNPRACATLLEDAALAKAAVEVVAIMGSEVGTKMCR